MTTNLAIDFGVGLIPVLGDFADAWFKCNTRNNILLEKYLREKGQKHPVAPPEPQTQQSGLRRWFGGGHPATHQTAPGSTAVPLQTSSHTGATDVKPELPLRNGARNVNTVAGGGQGFATQDLEAQIPNESNAIHYTRE